MLNDGFTSPDINGLVLERTVFINIHMPDQFAIYYSWDHPFYTIPT